MTEQVPRLKTKHREDFPSSSNRVHMCELVSASVDVTTPRIILPASLMFKIPRLKYCSDTEKSMPTVQIQ